MPYDDNNIFARILQGELPCRKVFENEYALAFHDIHPAAPVHVLVICRYPAISFHDFVAQASAVEVAGFFTAVAHIAAMLGVEAHGYRLLTNHGADAQQTVGHFHVHLLAGRPLGALLPREPGEK